MVRERSKRRRRLKLSENGPHNAKASPGTNEAWYYIEDGAGVTVVAELRTKAGYVGTTQAILTPTQIRKAAALLDRG